MLSCDVVIAASNTRFVLAYRDRVRTDCGLSFLLPRAIGQQRALAFSLVGKSASAA